MRGESCKRASIIDGAGNVLGLSKWASEFKKERQTVECTS